MGATSTEKSRFNIASSQSLTASYVVGDDLTSRANAYLSCYEEDVGALFITYTTGAGETGATCRFKIEFSHDGTDWFSEQKASETSGVVSHTDLVHAFGGGTGGTTYYTQYNFSIVARYIRISFTETGSPGNAGTVTSYLLMGAGISLGGGGTAGGGGTVFAEDAQHASGDSGTEILFVRNDTLAALAGTDGDYAPGQVNAQGAAYVHITDSSGTSIDSFGASFVDDSAFTPGTSAGSPTFFFADETGTDSVDEGDAGIARMTLTRKQITASEYPEDTASAAADYLTAIAYKRTESPADTSGTDGDYEALQGDNGLLWTNLGAYLNESDTPTARIGASATVTGMSPFFDSDGDNSAQEIKATSGNLYKLHVYNPNTAAAFVQLFNTASGSVTVGTTTPVYVLYVPPEGAVIEDFDTPLTFNTAITYACTTTATGNGDPTTGLTVSGGFV